MSTNTPYGSKARAPASSTFASLLQGANSLNQAEHDPELPQIKLGIEDIERMSESVGGRGKKKATRGEGHTLLSTLGINTTQLSHSIANLPVEGGPSTQHQQQAPIRRKRRHIPSRIGDQEQSQSVYTGGDLSTWGRNWHEMVILSGIETQRAKAVKSFQAQFQQRMLQNWEVEKARILQDELGVTDDDISGLGGGAAGGFGLGSVGLGKSAVGASTRRFPMAQSTSRSSENKDSSMVMHTKMIRYERVISELNSKRLLKQPLELCQALSNSVKGDPKQPLLPTSYNILAYLCQEPSLRDSSSTENPSQGNEPIMERQYASAYLGDGKGNLAVLLRGRLIAGGKRFLERDFENHIDETISKNPKEAALGGVPGIRNKVRAFTDVTLRNQAMLDNYRPETVDGIYLWAQLYFLLRAGYPQEALDLLSDHQNSLSKNDWSLPGAFKLAYTQPERKLPKPIRDQLFNDFNAHIRNNPIIDQFKYAIYKLVGRFELNKKSVKVAGTTEDWMWLQLSLVRENKGKERDSPGEQHDLEDLAALVRKYGNDKFDVGGTKPFAWFNLLLFTAQFERAVAYLFSKPSLRTDAVHFAIALSYYGLLRLPTHGDDSEILTTDTLNDTCYLNFARIIKTYISGFYKLEPTSALQYAYLVALGSDGPNGELQKQITLELVRDIVLASKSWSKLLGSVRADGTKETGIIERDLALLKLSDSNEYLRAVVLSAADQSSNDNSLIDSIELYHLSNSYNKVVESVNRALGNSLSQSGNIPLRSNSNQIGLISGAFGGAENVYGLAKTVYGVYDSNAYYRSGVDGVSWETLGVLLKLKLAMEQYSQDRPDLALETFTATNLLPLDSDPSNISRYSQKFLTLLDQPVISNLDEVIVTTMKCLHRLSQALKQSPYGDAGRMNALAGYKHQGMCLIQFASALRLRLGPDVYRQLSSMSAFF